MGSHSIAAANKTATARSSWTVSSSALRTTDDGHRQALRSTRNRPGEQYARVLPVERGQAHQQLPMGSRASNSRLQSQSVLAVRRRRGIAAGRGWPARLPVQSQGSAAAYTAGWAPGGRDDGYPVHLQPPPRDAGAVDGNDGEDLDVGHAEDLVRLVGLPQGRAQGRDEQWWLVE